MQEITENVKDLKKRQIEEKKRRFGEKEKIAKKRLHYIHGFRATLTLPQ